MYNLILIVAIFMGKSIFPESKEKTLYTLDSHICKICLPYKIPITFFTLDLVVQ